MRLRGRGWICGPQAVCVHSKQIEARVNRERIIRIHTLALCVRVDWVRKGLCVLQHA